jgi:acyl carrier protein
MDITKIRIKEVLDALLIACPEGKILENIDSLELVELVISLEAKFSLKESIVSDNTFSRTKSPFINIDSLADYIKGLLKNA